MNLKNIDWNFVNAVLELANILIIVIPALIIYFSYKINILNIYILENEKGGMIIGIHNITNKTIYLTNCKFVITSNNKTNTIGIEKIIKNKYLIIKPDELEKIKLDYKMLEIEYKSHIKISYNRKWIKISKRLK